MTDDQLLSFRSRYPILERTKYLVSHSLGAVPRSTAGAMAEFYELWARRGVRAWHEGWWEMSSEVGDLVAPFLGAAPGSVLMLPNVTTAEAVIISAFDYSGARNRIVMVEGEFPSVRYVHHGLAGRLGAEIVEIEARAGGIGFDLERLLAAIDERTALVPISHVLFESSFLIDVTAIAKRCRETGATMVLDVFQSAGIVPIDLQAWDVPIAVGGVLKWLCGGPGGGYLHVSEPLRKKLRPSLTGWMAHESPFDFAPPPIQYRNDIMRFGLGTPPIPALYAAREGLRNVSEAAAGGMGAIRAKSLRQTRRILEEATRRGFEIGTSLEDESRGGTVSIRLPRAEEVASELNARDIVCDYRPRSGVRLSPHFYTADTEIDAAFEAIDEILGL
ncbi:MAG TPA: aminotransferase class V-fold PLP-dependent enzyme [Thermoanaerobaculia bacterium]|nr:aminotransferase class V-fold PLP-dependent enzyme [Thermoanaerobaculia bacterium]